MNKNKINSITFLLPIGILFTVFLSIIMSIGIIYTGSNHITRNSSLSDISYLLLLIKSSAELDVETGYNDRLHHDISIMGTIQAVMNIAITDEKKNILISNYHINKGKPLFEVSRHAHALDFKSHHELKSVNYFFSEDEDVVEAFLSYSLPSKNEIRSTRHGIIFLSYDLSLIEEKMTHYIFSKMLTFGSASILIVVLSILLLRKYFLTPLRTLTSRIKTLTTHDYTQELKIKGCYEVTMLSDTFEALRKALLLKITELEEIAGVLESKVKERTKALQNANLKYKYAQDVAKLGHWEVDLTSQHFEFSQAAFDILGIENNNATNIEDLFQGLEGYEQSLKDDLIKKILDVESLNNDFCYKVRIKGEERYIRILTERVIEEHCPSKSIGIIQDVTEQKIKERSLIESQAKTRAIIDTAADAIVVINTEGIIQEFSPAGSKIFGYEKSEALGHDVSILMPEPNKSNHQKFLKAYYETGKQNVINTKRELLAQRKGGDVFPIELALTETKVADKTYFTAIIRDITQSKNSEKVLIEALKEAQSATRSKSEFLANMSHEIRTPMNAIIGLSHLALKSRIADKQQRYLEKINLSAKGLLGIINDILDISKIEAGKLRIEATPFRLEDVLENLSSSITFPAQEKEIGFSINQSQQIPKALIGDPLRLHQVLLNLCNNAIKFTPNGGKVYVNIEVFDKTLDTITLLFSISDNGIGVEEEKQKHLFDSFTQEDASTTRRYGGTGLGLSICKKLVNLMGGSIDLNSAKGEGSTFFFDTTFKIQACTVAPKAVTPLFLDKASIPQNSVRVLLVEDNEFNQEIAKDLLEDVGITVETAYNGLEALEHLKHQPFDLVLMDCQMPVMDGFQTTRKIREQPAFSSLPIIALTANVMYQDVERVFDCGMDDYLSKPLDIDNFYAKVQQWGIDKKQKEKAPDTNNTTKLPYVMDILKSNISIDADAALKYVHNDLSQLQKMQLKFREKQQSFSSQIREFLAQNDIENAIITVHNLKGQAGYLGLTVLKEEAQKLESGLRDNIEDPISLLASVELALLDAFRTISKLWD